MSYTLQTIDLFCGFGGWSTAARAAGVETANALNHNEDALMIHSMNYPKAAHYLVDVRQTSPAQYAKTDMFLGSPACTDFSQAKGVRRELEREGQLSFLEETDPKEFERKVAEVQSRATMWDVIKFVAYHGYAAGAVENVVEVHKWSEFPKWVRELEVMGYNYKFMYLNSMFLHDLNGVTGVPYAPQSRDRWYCVFWKKGLPAPDLDFRPLAPCPNCGNVRAVQIWKSPKKQWGKYGADNGQYYYGCPNCVERKNGRLRQLPVHPYYYAAINALNLDIPIEKIGDPNRKQKISEKTKARIKNGLEKFGNHPLMHGNKNTREGNYPYRSALLSPFYTQTTSDMIKISIPPFVYDSGNGGKLRDSLREFGTLTTQGSKGVLIYDAARGGKAYDAMRQLPTLTTKDSLGVALVELYGNGGLRDVREPLNTVTAGGGKTGVMLQTYNGNSIHANAKHDPIPTVTTIDRVAMSVWNGPIPDVDDIYYRTLRPRWVDRSGEIHSEIRSAMGFPFVYDITGNRKKPLAGREVTRGFGGAINPVVGKYLIEALLEGPLR